jgi:hypothetical protein
MRPGNRFVAVISSVMEFVGCFKFTELPQDQNSHKVYSEHSESLLASHQ